MNYLKPFMVLAIGLWSASAQAELVEYEFDINYQTVNFSGTEVQAMAVGGSIPAPTIEAQVGDMLRVTFNNRMDVPSSIHWHGILLPNDQDGVPYLTTSPIPAGESLTYEYPITHHGTYWYHSHTGLQEQRGVYGALVFHPREGELYSADEEEVIVLSDWTDENPHEVLRNLKREDDYYALKKGAVQSWDRVIQHGWEGVQNRILSSWTRMGPMDVSDVGYDAFLINGTVESHSDRFDGGETVRLRIVNASASSYQYVEFAGGSMTIVAADGVDTEPLEIDRLKIAVAETYDVLIKIPDDGMSYELRATSEDATGFASRWYGDGHRMPALTISPPNPFVIDHTGHGMKSQGMEGRDMNHEMMGHESRNASSLRTMKDYRGLRAVEATAFENSRPIREVPLTLEGNMERYVWSFNGETLERADKIKIRRGEVVRFVMKNETMMHHPVHLHGHFFRVFNGEGEYSPLKHTVNVPPMATVVIEFAADEEKDWFFHCHNLYHMKAGMARVVSYEGTPENVEFNKFVQRSFDPAYVFGEIGFSTNMADGLYRIMTNRSEVELEFDYDYDERYEVDLIFERRLDRFTGVYFGGSFEREEVDEKPENTGIVGIRYVLPFLIESDLRLNSTGEWRLEFENDHQLSERLNFDWRWNTDDEYRLGFSYELSKELLFTANHDSEYDAGIGIRLRF